MKRDPVTRPHVDDNAAPSGYIFRKPPIDSFLVLNG